MTTAAWPNVNEIPEDLHPGVDCCDSCLGDAEYDSSYSTWPLCCCRAVGLWDEEYSWATGKSKLTRRTER